MTIPRARAGVLLIALLCALLVLATPAFPAIGGSRSSSSGGSKSSGSSKPSSSSSKPGSRSSSKPGGATSSRPATATASKPSTGPKQQPAPVRKLIPPAPAPRSTTTTTGRGGSFLDRSPATRRTVLGQGNRDWNRDRDFISSNPRYADPYSARGFGNGVPGGGYYGMTDSPFFYLWLAGAFDGDNTRPQPPLTTGAQVSEAIVSYLGIIDAERKMLEDAEKASAAP